MPLIADPGRLLVARALAAGCEVTVLPGPSAVETALVASGLAAEGYAFAGWVPRAAGERARFLDRGLRGGAAERDVRVAAPPRGDARRSRAARARAPRGGRARADEAARGGRARQRRRGRRARRHGARRGLHRRRRRGARRARAPAPEALDAVRELVAHGLPARRASELVAALTGAPRRALYDAAAKAPKRPSPPTLP